MNCANTEGDSQAERKSSSSESSCNSKSGTFQKGTSSPGHEKQKRNEDRGDEEDDRERDQKRRRTLLSPPLDLNNSVKFSCPYREHNARKYYGNVKQWRTCAMTPLDSVARVK
jgi:hypothetical protein